MLFFVLRLPHYCEFKVEHTFSNQSFSRSSCNHHLLKCANITYFISVSVAVGQRFNAASKKKITLRDFPYIFSSKDSLKRPPLP